LRSATDVASPLPRSSALVRDGECPSVKSVCSAASMRDGSPLFTAASKTSGAAGRSAPSRTRCRAETATAATLIAAVTAETITSPTNENESRSERIARDRLLDSLEKRLPKLRERELRLDAAHVYG